MRFNHPVAAAACIFSPGILHGTFQCNRWALAVYTSQVRGVIAGGGSPCQGNFALNKHRAGLEDARSRQPEIQSKPIQGICQREVLFFGNVVSAESATVEQCDTWLGGCPIAIDAATCGWARILPGASRLCVVPCRLRGPSLVYVGKRPVPQCVFGNEGTNHIPI